MYVVDLSHYSKNTTFINGYRSKLTIGFQSPELLEGKLSLASDIWSLGIVFYCLLTGTMPFNGNSQAEIKKNICENDIDKNTLKAQGASHELIDLISQMLAKDAEKRPSAGSLLEHPFFQTSTIQAQSDKQVEMSFNKLQTFARKSKMVQAIKFQMAASSSFQSYEKNTLVQKFHQLDTDKNGFLTFNNLIELRNQAELRVEEEEIKEVFAKVDRKHSGKIKFEEFIAAFVNFRDEKADKSLRNIFNKMDKQKKGMVSKKEIQTYFNNDPEVVVEMEKMEHHFSQNKQVTYKEFKNMLTEVDEPTPRSPRNKKM
jgi:serine/threonine protein kinase